MKRIAVLTSGGDAPGMNAAVRAVVRMSIFNKIEVYAVQRGFRGLIEGDLKKMDLSSVGDIIHKGGTILRSARCPEFKENPSCRSLAIELLKVFKIEGLIVIGGDGSFMGMKSLSDLGFPGIGIPGTIDNDLAYTDYTIGFDTAVNTALDAITNLRDTTSSHERVTIVEVMGRNCGDIALDAGLAGGAEAILVPEIEYDIKEISRKLINSNRRGKKQSIIVVAEGIGNVNEIASEIKRLTAMDVRTTILGHIQRGGAPSAKDRILASEMGARAVELLLEGKSGRVIGVKNYQLIDMNINEALGMTRKFNQHRYELSKKLSI